MINPQPQPWPIGRCLLLLALVWLAFTWPWLAGWVTVPWDAKAHFYPQLMFLARALHDGDSPFWAPQVFAGHPQIADPQSLIFMPPMLLLALFNKAPSFAITDGVVFGTLGLGGVAVLLIFADRRWHWAGALVAAIIFCFGAAAAWRIQHVGQILSLAFLPWAFVCLDRALIRKSAMQGITAGVFAGFMVLGRDQVALLGAYLLAARVTAFVLASPKPARALMAAIPALGGGALAGALLTTVPILFSVLFAQRSNRPEIDFAGAGAGSLHPVHFLTMLNPDMFGSAGPMDEVWGPPSFAWPDSGLFLAQNTFVLYVGLMPFLLLIGPGIIRGGLFHREARLFAGALVLVTLYALGWYTPFFRLCYDFLPGIALYRRPADAVFLMGALFGVCSGYLVHRLMTGTLPKANWWRLFIEAIVIAGAFGAAALLAARFDRLQSKALVPLASAGLGLVLCAGLLLALAGLAARRPRLMSLLLIAALSGDLIWNNGPNPSTALPPMEYDALRPDSRDPVLEALKERLDQRLGDGRGDRIEFLGLGFHWPNAGLVHDLDHTLGYNPLHLALYGAAVGAGDSIGLPEQREFTPLFPSYNSMLANMLGLRYIAAPLPVEAIDTKLPTGTLTLIGRPGGRYLYENPRTLPRVLFATGVVEADFDAMIASGVWPAIDPLTTVALSRGTAAPRAPSAEPGSARIVAYRNTEVIIERARRPAGDSWF